MRTMTLALVVLAPVANASAQTPAFNARGASFALSVSDIQASSRWYSEKFGLKVTMNVPASNGPSVVVLEGGGPIVELIHHVDAQASGKDPVLSHGFYKAGFGVEDFDRTLATLRDRGVEIAYGPYPKRPDQRANVIIKDNAGNLIQIFGME
jgi:catechol 2,3-dioxygenase-like lactoylglutathione lyase family enzyme